MSSRSSVRLFGLAAFLIMGLAACSPAAGGAPRPTRRLAGFPVSSPSAPAAPSSPAEADSDTEVHSETGDSEGSPSTSLVRRPQDKAPGRWATYAASDGLPHDEVWSIADAPDGTLWFATSDGLARFDGNSWTSFHIEGDDGVGAHVRSVTVSGDGTFWAGTFMGGVSWSRGGGWTTYRTPIDRNDGPIANDVRVVYASPGGVLWVGTRAGLSRLDGQSWTHFTPDEGLAGFDVLAIAEAADGVLWVGTRGDFTNPTAGGLSRYDGDGWESFTEANGLAENYVQAIATEPDGAVWVGTRSRGAARFDGQVWQAYSMADGLPSDDVTAVAVADDGGVWLGTRGAGAARFDGEEWELVTESDGLASNDVRAIVILPSGSVWFATARGVSRYVPAG